MLKGQAKRDYQRRYMRGYMRELRRKGQPVKTYPLRPISIGTEVEQPEPLTTPGNSSGIAYIDADGNPVYDE